MRYYPIGKYLLAVPLEHRLREYQNAAVLYDRSTWDLIDVICNAFPSRPIVDIGANIGDTAAYVRTYCSNRIICVEGAAQYLSYLQHNLKVIGSCLLVEKFVRPRGLPSCNLIYTASDGTGRISVCSANQSGGLQSSDFVSLEEVRVVAEEAGGCPVLFKTDTDGFDAPIINEALESFESVFWFECDPFNLNPDLGVSWSLVFRKLAERRCKCIVFDNFGLPLCCLSGNAPEFLGDLLAYVRSQRAVDNVRIHYFDVWAFPEPYHSLYDECAARLRSGLLSERLPL